VFVGGFEDRIKSGDNKGLWRNSYMGWGRASKEGIDMTK